jgi:Concanavalin A-like lectin/glucanases superfamily
MKINRTVLTVSVLIVGLGLAVNGYSQSFLTNGLVAYYPFNGNAHDASGNGHDGTNHGGVLVPDRFGYPNQAYLFGGPAAYITAPFSSSVFNGDFTVSVWFNAYDIADAWPALLEEAGNSAFRMQIVGQTSGAYPYSIGRLVAYAAHGGPNKDWEMFVPPPTLNTFYQVVVERAGTNVTMYLNAQLGATGQVSSPTVEPGNTLWIGRSETEDVPGAYVFHGVIDDIRIYNRALSSNEVAQLYAIESGPRVDLLKAVKPSFFGLLLGTNYQLQVSGDLSAWTNQGSAFTATNTTMIYPQYFDVDNWRSLFFRL